MVDIALPAVMGILNVTPDSFSDGGHFVDRERAVARGLEMQAQGAAIIDVGGESTRPNAAAVSLQQELDRVLPVIEQLRPMLDSAVLSVDTSKPEVMRAAVDAGVSLINDVNALRAQGAMEVAAETGAAVCLMHRKGTPEDMQRNPHYDDVASEVRSYLAERIAACTAAGIDRRQLIVDPGFGFGKTLEHNLVLLRELGSLASFGVPVLVGLSRKSMLGALTGRSTDDRLAASVAAAVLAAERGASIFRVHDVAETVDALKLVTALRGRSR